MYRFTCQKGGDFSAAHEIRDIVFIREQGFSMDIDGLDDSAYHYILYDGDRAVATSRAFLGEDGLCKIGRFAVLKEYRGQRLGARMMREFEEELRAVGAKKFKLSAQLRAAGFYEKQGYVRTGEIYYEEYCPHVDMVKEGTHGG